MSKNCLVTKLKAAVNNASLPILGEMVVDIKSLATISDASKQQKMIIKSDTPFSVYPTGSTLVGTSLQSLSDAKIDFESGSRTFYFSNNDGQLHIVNKYGITEIEYNPDNLDSLANVNLSDLKYIDGLVKINLVNSASGDIANLNGKTFRYFDFGNGASVFGDISGLTLTKSENIWFKITDNANIYGNIDIFDGVTLNVLRLTNTKVNGNISILNTTYGGAYKIVALGGSNVQGDLAGLNGSGFRTLELQDCNVYGELADFSTCTDAISIRLSDNAWDNEGSIETFVAAQVAAGRTSCDDLFILNLLSHNTFGGSTRSGNANQHIRWASSGSKIAVFCGATSISNCTTVFYKGYSTSELDAVSSKLTTYTDVTQ